MTLTRNQLAIIDAICSLHMPDTHPVMQAIQHELHEARRREPAPNEDEGGSVVTPTTGATYHQPEAVGWDAQTKSGPRGSAPTLSIPSALAINELDRSSDD